MESQVKMRANQYDEMFVDTIVVGSGCAAYNAADWLWQLGKRDIAILTEGKNVGTSRNTGSDKQTYYKLSLCSDGADSVRQMAETLFHGGCVDGDITLCEAANSVKCFMKLVNIGVPFPTNGYGEYVGYKTDHDPRQRATSVGPLTSKYMTEALERQVEQKKIPLYDGFYVARLLVENGRVVGLLAIDTASSDPYRIRIFACNQVILATGGPAGIYFNSVYPECHTGSSSLAIEAGATLCNLQEWQYGLASTQFRWNVSGTYQQVIPRYISVDAAGNRREFLRDYYADPLEAAYQVFLKGYQWPFDSAKIQGSSNIDVLVYHEIFGKGNHVFMDFTTDPAGLNVETFSHLPQEAYDYLKNSGALMETPIARLKKMNEKAIALYADHGIDLMREPLEVSVCAQHNNGGIEVDSHWQSSVQGLYVAGEAAGTFGIYRPGGSALNSTQVGSMRAAEHIAFEACNATDEEAAFKLGRTAALELTQLLDSAKTDESNVIENRLYMQKRMSEVGAHLRNTAKMRQYLSELESQNFYGKTKFRDREETVQVLKNRDILLTQIAVLKSMIASAETAGSRGSCLVISGETPQDGIVPEKMECRKRVTCIKMTGQKMALFSREVRPIPPNDDWFENVWNRFNQIRKIK